MFANLSRFGARRPFLIPLLYLALAISFIATARSADADATTYQTNAIEGWRLLIDHRLLTNHKPRTDRALQLLRSQLHEIVRVIPPPALTKLREVTLWFSPEYPGVPPKAEYHPAARWLRDNGRNETMVQSVEFTNIRIFEAESKRMTNFVLHELAHAYHHRVLTNGFDNAEIQAAYDRAKKSGAYDKVERRNGEGRPITHEKAYAMVNPMEYFAETTEAYFSRNDFYPFTRADLKQTDSHMHALLTKLWGEHRDP